MTVSYNAVFTGTSVMTVTATDIDEPGNENSQIAYSIIKETPPHNMFGIHRNGTVYVKSSALDREVQYELFSIVLNIL